MAWWTEARQAWKQGIQSRNQSLFLTATKIWRIGGTHTHKMDQQFASYPIMCHHLKAYKIFFSLFGMTRFNVYILYEITSQKLKYNKVRSVRADEFQYGLIMLEYARWGGPAADTPIRLQAAHWAHFPQYTPPNPVKANPSRQCRVCSNRQIKSTCIRAHEVCNVALHTPECLKIYYKNKNY
jgi:hypothetical protein